MFKLFRKNKDSLTDIDRVFLETVVNNLPEKYDYLKRQVHKDFIVGKERDLINGPGRYGLIVDGNYESQFSDKSKPQYFIIKDIRVWNKNKSAFERVELDIIEGMIMGYYLSCDSRELDLNKIDISWLKEKHFRDEDKEQLLSIVGQIDKDDLSKLDISSTFRIDIEQGAFYVIKNLEDGNYLAVNKKGEVYGLVHDPYTVEKIFDSVPIFVDALKNGSFSFDKYLESKYR